MAQAGAPRFRLFLLGGFELRAKGRPPLTADWERRKAQALLKFLALQAGGAATRDAAIEALWPGADPDAGLNNLHQVAHVIRRAVGEDSLVCFHGGTVALCGGTWVDAEAFRAAAADPRTRSDRHACDRALALYRGPLLPEDPYEDWLAAPRDRLAALHRTLLLRGASLHADAGDAARAEELLRAAIAADATDEEASLRLMRLLDDGGAPHRALAQYRALESALRDELDVEPSPEAARLYHDIRERMERRGVAAPPLDVRHVRSADGTSIAYAVHAGGDGVPLLIQPDMPWGNLEAEWEIPAWRAWVARLVQKRTVVRFDLRGGGLSQADVADISLERQVEDIEAVARAAGLRRFALLTVGASAPIAVTYAARRPERVSHLLMYYGTVSGARYAQTLGGQGMRAMMVADWELYVGAVARAVDGTGEMAAELEEWVRASMPRDTVLRYWDMATALDATARHRPWPLSRHGARRARAHAARRTARHRRRGVSLHGRRHGAVRARDRPGPRLLRSLRRLTDRLAWIRHRGSQDVADRGLPHRPSPCFMYPVTHAGESMLERGDRPPPSRLPLPAAGALDQRSQRPPAVARPLPPLLPVQPARRVSRHDPLGARRLG